jgi:hypothetical protein
VVRQVEVEAVGAVLLRLEIEVPSGPVALLSTCRVEERDEDRREILRVVRRLFLVVAVLMLVPVVVLVRIVDDVGGQGPWFAFQLEMERTGPVRRPQSAI